jgi:hypothetical protein
MAAPFSIIQVPDDAAQAEEAMGSKFKFWYQDENLGQCLYKEARLNTGEDWAEKLAAELAELLKLPHAGYEMAVWCDRRGTVSPQILPSNTDLIHGNDILSALISGYPRSQGYNLSQHTWSLVLDAITRPEVKLPLGWDPLAPTMSAVSVFVGYLLLDAWIGNSDRHHENWGFVYQKSNRSVHLAPTYDHASCLGRELLDTARDGRLRNKTVGNYATKARSAFYEQAGDRKAVLTFDLFCKVAQRYGQSAQLWLAQLAKISETEIRMLMEGVPSSRITPVAAEFAYEMLEFNRVRLLLFGEGLG